MKTTPLSLEAFGLAVLEQQATIQWPAGVPLRHFKDHQYLAYLLVENAETGEQMVVYRSVETGQFSARALSKFTDEMELGGAKVPRFELVEFLPEEADLDQEA